MDRREVFEIWAPTDGRWSSWAKPVMFSQIDEGKELSHVDIPDIRVDRPKAGDRVFVIDLPGLESIGLGVELAGLGYRPVPLFNSSPSLTEFLGENVPEVVPTSRLLSALQQAAARLKSLQLPADSAPAFLLDANRLGVGDPINSGWYDNRWVVFPTDFPSASFLLKHHTTEVELIHRGGKPSDDILDILREWNRAGIPIWHTDLNLHGPPSLLNLPPVWYASLSRLMRRIWAMFNLRRNPSGGYGGMVPEPSSSGG